MNNYNHTACTSPKVKILKFDDYQLTHKQAVSGLRSKTEAQLLPKRNLLNLQLVSKDDKSYSNHEHKEAQTQRVITLQDVYLKSTRRVSKSVKHIIRPQPTVPVEQLDNIKMRFIRISEMWRIKEAMYIKQQQIMRQEIVRLQQIVDKITK